MLFRSVQKLELTPGGVQRNYLAALESAKLQTYEVRPETLEANKGFEVSGTGLARPVAV